MPISRLGRQIAELATALNANAVGFALIGGLALASHNVVRATQDDMAELRGYFALFDREAQFDELLREIG
jgi:hypothetical protein